MRYSRAVERLRLLADACQRTTRPAIDEPLLVEAHVFGEVLAGVDPVESAQIAVVLDLPPEEVPWCSQPRETAWPRVPAPPADLARRTEVELGRALAHVRTVHERFWEHDWRSRHRGSGRRPEDTLWEAVDGYLDLLKVTHGGARGRT